MQRLHFLIIEHRSSVTTDSRDLKHTLMSSEGSVKQKRSKNDVKSKALPAREIDEDTVEYAIRGTRVRRHQAKRPVPPTSASESRGQIENVVGFMLQDSSSFAPSQDEVVALTTSIFELISTTTATISNTTDTRYTETPEISRFENSLFFMELCKLIYGFGDIKTLIKKHHEAQKKSHMTLSTFLHALIAVAVKEWVFEGQHSPLPPTLSEMSSLGYRYEQIVAEGQSSGHRNRALGY